jgi:phage terminase small subunit
MHMSKRGRKSSASYEVPVIDVDRIPVQPPEHLGEIERERFADIVSSCNAGHFSHSDISLLCRYVEADVLAEEAAAELRKHGAVVDGRPSPWLIIQEKQVRALIGLSLRLRLCPSARIDRKSTALRARQEARIPPWE